jgi:hypothetical protein
MLKYFFENDDISNDPVPLPRMSKEDMPNETVTVSNGSLYMCEEDGNQSTKNESSTPQNWSKYAPIALQAAKAKNYD